MKRSRVNARAPAAKSRKFPTTIVVGILIILLAISFVIGYIWNILKDSDYFLVREVVVRGNNADFSYFKGRNINSLDLERESRNIAVSYPGFSRINIAKVLPGRVYVDFVERKPVAFIKLYRYFAVDESGMLFNSALEPRDLQFPVITGLESKMPGARPGVRYGIKELTPALMIAAQAERSGVFKVYKIRRIDVSSPGDAVIYIAMSRKVPDYLSGEQTLYMEDLEVKMGSGDMNNKVAFLAGLLAQARGDVYNFKYIDLRFKEPVIKMKDVKTK